MSKLILLSLLEILIVFRNLQLENIQTLIVCLVVMVENMIKVKLLVLKIEDILVLQLSHYFFGYVYSHYATKLMILE